TSRDRVLGMGRSRRSRPESSRDRMKWRTGHPAREAHAESESAMNQKESLTTIGQRVPELPVADVEKAQQYYRDVLGFEIGWLYPGGGIGSVSRGNAVIFFRRREEPFEPAIHWLFAADIDATYEEFQRAGSKIVEPLE